MSSTLLNNLLKTLVYIDPNKLLTIRKIIASSHPRIGIDVDKAPKQLNTVCHW